jgi:hypothetical protein
MDSPECEHMFNKFLTGESDPNFVSMPHVAFPDANVFQKCVLVGDIRFVEAMVARGAGLDAPFLRERGDFKPAEIVAPSDATPLLMTIAHIAMAELNHPILVTGRDLYHDLARRQLSLSTECAMQLVRLGADLTRKVTLSNAEVRL